MFLGTALLADEPVPKVQRRFTGTGQRRRCQLHMANCHTTQRQKRTMPQNQLNSANHVVSVFAGIIQCEFAMVAYNEILFYISYSLCLSFRLCSSLVIFYTSLEVIKLAFLVNKSRYVCYILANFTFTNKKLINFEKNRVMCILQTLSVTLFFLYFYYPHDLESDNTYNKE